MPWLPDTNVLLRWIHVEAPERSLILRAFRTLRRQGETLAVVPQCLAEFWNVSTRPVDVGGYGLTPAETGRAVRKIETAFTLLPETPTIYPEWRRLVLAHEVKGRQVHDARLAAQMLVHGVSHVLTFNDRDFARYPGITAVHPVDLAGP